MLTLPVVYPITDRKLSGLSHADQVLALADGGCRLVQIRIKDGTSSFFYDETFRSLEIARARGCRLIVNDRVDIAVAAGADGVHLGQNDLSPDKARELLGDQAVIGYSTHSIEQAVGAAGLPVDYLAIGPIFPTTTKQDPDPVVGLEGLRRVRDAVHGIPLVAIGGITRSNIADVIGAGANSAAVIGDLFARPVDIAASYAQLVAAASVKH